jgi:glycosyltransferase involved in cell wall biosynthesis
VIKVLLVSADTVGPSMAGPGIRYWEFARHLAPAAEVVLAVPPGTALDGDGFRVEPGTLPRLTRLVRWADVVVCQGFRLPQALLHLGARVVVVDLYDPVPLAVLELYRAAARAQGMLGQQVAAARLRSLCRLGDAFLCTGARQRDFWLGALAAAGRLNWDTYAGDPRLERLLMVVPFGLPAAPPARAGAGVRERWPGIAATDRVLLWGGGLWDWLDPLTVIRAMARVTATRADVKLVFMGGRHPNARVAPMRMPDTAIDLARSLGLLDRHVFFNASWVPYEERGSLLLDADIGLSAHLDQIEARFAFRTRLLDYFWAGLPVICTEGDDLAEAVRARDAGLVVGAGDVEGWAGAIRRLLDDGALAARARAGARALGAELRWERVVAPLRAFCQDPRRAPDRARRTRLAGLGGLGGYAWDLGRVGLRHARPAAVRPFLRRP